MGIFAQPISQLAQATTITTSETTGSTSYTDLTTPGPSVTVNIGASGLALVAMSCNMNNNTTGDYVQATIVVSGANTIAAQDVNGFFHGNAGLTDLKYGITYLLTGLTAGSTTFKMQYKVNGGTGTFQNRKLAVVPF